VIGVTVYWVIFNWGDVESQLHGPYMKEEEQLEKAEALVSEGQEGTVILLDIVGGRPKVETFASI